MAPPEAALGPAQGGLHPEGLGEGPSQEGEEGQEAPEHALSV